MGAPPTIQAQPRSRGEPGNRRLSELRSRWRLVREVRVWCCASFGGRGRRAQRRRKSERDSSAEVL